MIRSFLILTASIVAAPALTGFQAAAQSGGASKIDNAIAAERITRFMEDARAEWNAPAISAAVGVRGEIVYAGGVGTANIAERTPATESTVYRIASTSKVITATAVLQLVERGKVQLDDDIRKYVPQFPRKKWPITVRQVLTHTSGIRHYNPGETSRKKEHYGSVAAAIGLFKDDTLQFQPGTRYGYTTYGYTLLQGVVEAASGMSYDEYLDRNIFGPADMPDSDLEFVGRRYPKRATGYRLVDGEIAEVTFDDVSFKFAGGGMLSSALDLVKFCMALIDEELLRAETVAEMFTEQFPDLDRGNGYAWGLGIEEESGLKRAWHPGRSNGFESYLICYPEAEVYVSVLTNQHYTNPWNDVGELAGFLANLYLPGGIEEAADIPDRSLRSALLEALENEGRSAALATYREYVGSRGYRMRNTESEVNSLGYELIGAGRLDDAVAAFEMNIEMHPESSNAYDSLGEGYMTMGELELAVRNYERSLELDPENANATRQLEKLRAAATPPEFEPAGSYELSGLADIDGRQTELTIGVHLDRAADGSYSGSVETSISPPLSITQVIAGGDRLWITTATPDGPFELELSVAGAEIMGRWLFGSMTGPVEGRKVSHPR